MTIKEVVEIFRKTEPEMVPNSIDEYDAFFIMDARNKKQPPDDYYNGAFQAVIWKESKKIEWLDILDWGPLVEKSEFVRKINSDEFERYNK